MGIVPSGPKTKTDKIVMVVICPPIVVIVLHSAGITRLLKVQLQAIHATPHIIEMRMLFLDGCYVFILFQCKKG
jgi:hypothetical protein